VIQIYTHQKIFQEKIYPFGIDIIYPKGILMPISQPTINEVVMGCLKPSYGYQIVNALRESGVTVDIHFNYQGLPAPKKDIACRELIITGDENIACECIPGVTEYGDHLAHIYWAFPMFYAVLLRRRIYDQAKADTTQELEQALVEYSCALETEATLRAGLTKGRLLMLLVSDPQEFLFQVNLAVIKYLNSFIANEIEDVIGEVVCH